MIKSPNSPRRKEYHVLLVVFFKHRHLVPWGEGEQSWAQIRESWYLPRENNSRSLHPRAVQCTSVLKERICQARSRTQVLPALSQELPTHKDTTLTCSCLVHPAAWPPSCVPGDQHSGLFFHLCGFLHQAHLSDLWLQPTHRITP